MTATTVKNNQTGKLLVGVEAARVVTNQPVEKRLLVAVGVALQQPRPVPARKQKAAVRAKEEGQRSQTSSTLITICSYEEV